MPDPTKPEDPRPAGDAASLFDTDEIRPVKVTPIQSVEDGYDLVGGGLPDQDEPIRPVPIPVAPIDRPRPRSRPRPQPKVEDDEPAESDSTEFASEVSDVDPVWTRLEEWTPDLIKVVSAGLGTLVLTWLMSGWGLIGILIFLGGGAATVFLSYPLLITLERPVRITPEQAVTDFYAAASHRFPSYRRMWLLLSVRGRDSGPFPNFEAFRDHWQTQVDRWRQAAGVGKYGPLKFEVDGFRADKSTGKETSRANYTINVYARDHESQGALDTFRMNHGLVKGPDRMWYLNQGVLRLDPK